MNKVALLFFLIVFSSCSNSQAIITSKNSNLPKPVGPYSHSIEYGDLIFVSGQIGIDPKTNILKNGIDEQTIQVLENLETLLQSSNSDIGHIVKTTIFITDIKQFDIVNKIYSSYFKGRFPARSTIEVSSLPKNASIEIECIAVKIRTSNNGIH